MKISDNTLTAEQFISLTSSVGWKTPSFEQAELALQNQVASFTVYEDDRLAGMARLLGDGATTYYIKQFLIHPSMQGKGLGSRLISHILDYVKDRTPKGWTVSIELLSSAGKEPFYERFGFTILPNSHHGAGMIYLYCQESARTH